MLVTSQLPIQSTKFFYIFWLVPPHFEKGSATHGFNPTTFYVWSLQLKTLCYIGENAKSYLALSECFCYQLCLSSSQCFAMIALLQTSQRLFSNQQDRHWQGHNEVRWRPGQEASLAPHVRTWGLSEANSLYWRKYLWHCWVFSTLPAVIRRPGNCAIHAPPRHWAKFWIFQAYMSKLLTALVCLGSFFARHYLLAQLNHFEISRVVGQKHSTMLSFEQTRSLSAQANHFGFAKLSNCIMIQLYAWSSFDAS